MPEDLSALPIFPHLDDLANTLAREGRLLLSAETGAGKTTLLPWKLLDSPLGGLGKILLLEPRRLAARAAADRIAALRGERVGAVVGLRTRLETVVGAATRLEVVTEGVLTRLLQADPGLTGYGTVLFDEFHTRSVQGDLGLALAWDARRVLRPDLAIGVLSATLPAADLQRVYGDWPLVQVPGRLYEVETRYRPPASPHEKVWEAAARLCAEALGGLGAGGGTVLCFLPGHREMVRAQDLLRSRLGAGAVHVTLLHGRMPAAAQREVLDPASARGTRVILATNVAETSLTVPGVKAVVDLGLERRVRFSPRTGMDHWDTLPISTASADQRRGRAGRLGPGVCFRWWPEGEARAAFAPPEIAEADLAPLVLETALWGAASPLDLAWVTPPPEAQVKQASAVLRGLGLLGTDGRITPAGREAAGFAVHPRLAKMVLSVKGTELAETAAAVAALLENDDLLAGPDPDLRDRLAAFGAWARGARAADPAIAKRVWEDLRRILRRLGRREPEPIKLDLRPQAVGALLLAAYPERAAQRTRLDDPRTSRWLLASGRGAWLTGELSSEDYVVAADLDGGEQDARIFLAAPVTRADLESGRAGPVSEDWTLDWRGWTPKATLQLKLGAIVLHTKAGRLPPQDALIAAALARLAKSGLTALPWSEHARRFLARCRFVEKWGGRQDWPAFGDEHLLAAAGDWLVPFGTWDKGAVWDESAVALALETYLGRERRRLLEELAPETWILPTGTHKKLDYESNDVPTLSARLQEFFGCATTPRLCGQPLLLDLVSPAGRTVQRTHDLDGFWDRTYPEVKKELMGRYPRHPWPDDPRAARPTARAKPKKK